MVVQQLEVVFLFRRGTSLDLIFIIIILGKGPDGITMREQSQKQEIRCQGNKGQVEKSLEKLLCAPKEKLHIGVLSQLSLLRFIHH